MKWMRRICLALLLLLFVGGCSYSNPPKEWPLGLNVELSGRLSQYGMECKAGVELAVNELNRLGGVNGKKIRLICLDNKSENSDSVLALRKLREKEKVLCVIGPSTSSAVKAELMNETEIPILVPSATSDFLVEDSQQKNFFRICFTDSTQGEAMGGYSYQLGFRRVALLLDSSSDYSRSTTEHFIRAFERAGGVILSHEYYNTGDTDFSVALTQLKRESPDAIYLPGYYTEAGMAIRQARQIGLDCAFLSGDTFDSPLLEELASPDGGPLDGIYFTNHYSPEDKRLQAFAETYQKRYGTFPSAYAALGYDCAMLFADALSRCDNVTRDTLRQSLQNTDGFPGVTGDITFEKGGNAQKEPLLNGILAGKRILVDIKEP